jgi:ribosomal-protein-alanine N-acetyltransferase
MANIFSILPLISPFRLQKLDEKDIPSLLSLEKELFPVDYWTEYTFRQELKKDPKSIQVIKNKFGVIGYVHTEVWNKRLPSGRTVRIGEIGSIAVHKDHRGKKLGEKLLKQGIKTLKKKRSNKIIIHTRLDNAPMKKLAEVKFGFKTEKIKKNAYEDGASAYRMSLS